MTKKFRVPAGFAVTELIVAVLVVAGLATTGWLVLHRQKTPTSTNSVSKSQTSTASAAKTTIDTTAVTAAANNVEAAADANVDAAVETNINSAAGAVEQLTGAYDEANF